MEVPYGTVAKCVYDSFSGDDAIIYTLADTTCILEIDGVQTPYNTYNEAEKALFEQV